MGTQMMFIFVFLLGIVIGIGLTELYYYHTSPTCVCGPDPKNM